MQFLVVMLLIKQCIIVYSAAFINVIPYAQFSIQYLSDFRELELHIAVDFNTDRDKNVQNVGLKYLETKCN